MFPTNLPSFTTSDPNKTLDEDNHTKRHNDVQNAIVSVATKVGVDGSADTGSMDYKLAGIENNATANDTDANLKNRANHTGTQTASTISDIESVVEGYMLARDQKRYPVGKIWISTDSTNPGHSSVLGFGTWVAYGEGRVIVGKAASGTFGTAGATGGAEAHTLTIAEMPSHGHKMPNGYSGGTVANPGNYLATQWRDPPGSGVTGGPNSSNTGGGGAHNNLQPYIVAYMWERTA